MDNKTIKILENIDYTEDQTLNKQKLLNLLKLTKENNINIFDEKKGKIKSKRKILQECTSTRNQKIERFVKVLDEKKEKTKSNTKIKILNDKFMKELESLENIVSYVNDKEFKIFKTISETNMNTSNSNNPIENSYQKDTIDIENEIKFKINSKENEFIEVFSNDPI
tara:strand:+ start:3503 stop:4003 length:501 start_codon:yes stop_codon:yes gene_type:complete